MTENSNKFWEENIIKNENESSKNSTVNNDKNVTINKGMDDTVIVKYGVPKNRDNQNNSTDNNNNDDNNW